MDVPLLRMSGRSREIELRTGRWGLVPHWWKETKPPRSSFNARLEEAAAKPMWRDAFRRSRCLIPAEGWYEWQERERVDQATGEVKTFKQPSFIRRRDRAVVLLRRACVLVETLGGRRATVELFDLDRGGSGGATRGSRQDACGAGRGRACGVARPAVLRSRERSRADPSAAPCSCSTGCGCAGLAKVLTGF